MQRTINQSYSFSQSPPTWVNAWSSTICAIVERPDHRCGDDLVDILQLSFLIYTLSLHYENNNKIITTMVIRPLDDHTYCAQSVLTHLGLWRKLNEIVHCITSQPANLLSNVLYRRFRRYPTFWNMNWGLFEPQFGGLEGRWRVGISPFDSPPVGSY